MCESPSDKMSARLKLSTIYWCFLLILLPNLSSNFMVSSNPISGSSSSSSNSDNGVFTPLQHLNPNSNWFRHHNAIFSRSSNNYNHNRMSRSDDVEGESPNSAFYSTFGQMTRQEERPRYSEEVGNGARINQQALTQQAEEKIGQKLPKDYIQSFRPLNPNPNPKLSNHPNGLSPTDSELDYYLMSSSEHSASPSDRFSRYLLLSPSKRNSAGGGYMCHFKLCQLGASGKRRWNPSFDLD